VQKFLRASFIHALFILLSLFFSYSPPSPSYAQTPARPVLVALAPIRGAEKIELVSQTLDVNITEAGDNTLLTGQLVFKLHNTDRLNRVELVVGFPTWGGGAFEFNEKNLAQFTIAQGGLVIKPEAQMQPLKLGSETRTVRWLVWPLSLDQDERETIQVNFRYDLGNSPLPTFTFAQAPAVLWKGLTGSARYTFRFPALTTTEQLRQLAPNGSVFDGASVTWQFTDYEPNAPITLQIIKPQLWRELTQARRTLSAGTAVELPSQQRAALSIGNVFAQLARASQSNSDLTQAIAAWQRASELAPNDVTAPLALAQTYEALLRGEFGRNANDSATRALALEQWERVWQLNPNHTEARDAIAQHTFTLAQLARRAQQFDAAQTFLQRARNANSNKLNVTQLAQEERALTASISLRQWDNGERLAVLAQIATGALGDEAADESRTFQPMFNAAQANILIEDAHQTITLKLSPFPTATAQHETMLRKFVEALRAQNTATVELSIESGVYQIAIAAATQPLNINASDVITLPLMREVLMPAELHAAFTQGDFATTYDFVARYSFAETERMAQAQLQTIDRTLTRLRQTADDESDETIRRVRVSVLEWYRLHWQSLLTSLTARIEVRAQGQTLQAWTLRAGETRTLQAQQTRYYDSTLIGLTTGSIGLVLLTIAGIAVLRPRRKYEV
jgi:tetratricopeptide (TPR) repeat protein